MRYLIEIHAPTQADARVALRQAYQRLHLSQASEIQDKGMGKARYNVACRWASESPEDYPPPPQRLRPIRVGTYLV